MREIPYNGPKTKKPESTGHTRPLGPDGNGAHTLKCSDLARLPHCIGISPVELQSIFPLEQSERDVSRTRVRAGGANGTSPPLQKCEPTFEIFANTPVVREFVTMYQLAMGTPVVIVAPGPAGIAAFMKNSSHPLCALLGATTVVSRACQRFHAKLQADTDGESAPCQRQCRAGLVHITVPIVIGGRHVATFVFGPVFERRPSQREASRLARELRQGGLRVSGRRVYAACTGTRVLDDVQIRAAGQLLHANARLLADHASRWIGDASSVETDCIARATTFIRAQACGAVSIHDVAKHVHLNADYLGRIFAKATGLTFTDYLAVVRVERAKEQLKNLAVRVSEVAFACGFQSIQHFNLVFRRRAGVSPTQYRVSLRR